MTPEAAHVARRLAGARTLADQFVENHDLRPPVDVYSLVAACAEIRRVYVDETIDVDAIVHGLGGERIPPVVVLNDRRPDRRIRFTLGHELGHLNISWHLGTLGCQTEEGGGARSGDDPSFADALISQFEAEADAFASRVLLPARFVRSLSRHTPGEMVAAVEAAEVSPPAALRSLAAQLPPGYVFVLLASNGRTIHSYYRSPGTNIPGMTVGRLLDEKLTSEALDDQGRARLDGRPVWWGYYQTSLAVPPGSADWMPMLEGLIEEVAPGEGRSGSTWKSIAGIVGAANSTTRDDAAGVLAARIRRQVRKRPELAAVYEHPRFLDFVMARTRDLRG